MTRPFVTFLTSDAFPVEGKPPGGPLAHLVATGLETAGAPPEPPAELGEWGWEIFAKEPRGSATATFQWDPIRSQWTIDLHAQRKLRFTSSARREATAAASQLLAAWAGAIHATLVAHPDIHDVRWWYAADFDAQVVWADRPDA